MVVADLEAEADVDVDADADTDADVATDTDAEANVDTESEVEVVVPAAGGPVLEGANLDLVPLAVLALVALRASAAPELLRPWCPASRCPLAAR